LHDGTHQFLKRDEVAKIFLNVPSPVVLTIHLDKAERNPRTLLFRIMTEGIRGVLSFDFLLDNPTVIDQSDFRIDVNFLFVLLVRVSVFLRRTRDNLLHLIREKFPHRRFLRDDGYDVTGWVTLDHIVFQLVDLK